MATRLTDQEIAQVLARLTGWTREGEEIHKKFTFASFPDAITFVVRVGFAAEAVDHHPGLQVDYKRVTVSYTTHSEGGLTQKDADGAREAERFAAALIRTGGE